MWILQLESMFKFPWLCVSRFWPTSLCLTIQRCRRYPQSHNLLEDRQSTHPGALECPGLAGEESAGTQVLDEFRKTLPTPGDALPWPEPRDWDAGASFHPFVPFLSNWGEGLPGVWHLRGEGRLLHCFFTIDWKTHNMRKTRLCVFIPLPLSVPYLFFPFFPLTCPVFPLVFLEELVSISCLDVMGMSRQGKQQKQQKWSRRFAVNRTWLCEVPCNVNRVWNIDRLLIKQWFLLDEILNAVPDCS